MPKDRDIEAFDDRATDYERGWRGRLHHDIALRTADIALTLNPEPQRVLDVGCGTGLLLRLLADRLPHVDELVGIDAAEGMIAVARSMAKDPRIRLSLGVAESLPYPDHSFDLVVSTTSFDHWKDQGLGLAECARVLAPGGHVVLTDLFSVWLAPTMLVGHRDRARTRRRADALLKSAGFDSVTWHTLYRVIIGTAVAYRSGPAGVAAGPGNNDGEAPPGMAG
jgi:ubiquinone/menaquinone biosynthesis C-methylase UbiE